MSFLLDGFLSVTWQQILMYLIGGLLIYLAIEKDFEPALLMPMGFGAILVNRRSQVCSTRRWRRSVDPRHHQCCLKWALKPLRLCRSCCLLALAP